MKCRVCQRICVAVGCERRDRRRLSATGSKRRSYCSRGGWQTLAGVSDNRNDDRDSPACCDRV